MSFRKTIGFIGSGRMATALARGCVQSGLVPSDHLLAADPSEAACASFAEKVPQAGLVASNAAVLSKADVAVLAVKPQMMPDVLAEISDHIQKDHLIVSIAAGVTLQWLESQLPVNSRVIRVMPNTPCLIGLGASCFSRGNSASREDGQVVQQILESVGLAYEIEEPLLDAVTGLSGSGPAFVYRFIESLAEGGSSMGLPGDLAMELAAQTTRGAAEMVLTTGQSPAKLREQVTSPGGTTLAGLETLEKLHGAEAIRAAVESATRRSQELGQS